MKRSALILLTAIYLLSCVGIGVNRFYCCGKLASTTLFYGADDNANKQAGKDNNCCKNERQSFKVKDTHVSSYSFTFSELSPVILPTLAVWDAIIPVKEHALIVGYQSNAPPGNLAIPIYTLNCTYRI
ncbi:MAG: hypothetical protein JWQ34_880 [Mucilaginibacter sp.]|uniref:HYC_CC_PP family protein n=1 Tax=Mucilaginibacter sp. TaxID=1882438 RepID=UPI00261614C4|nr:hypothetical protein [Mucilaginibacter sp.]MDB5002655.1 hypothetical protein [Mucilaginibacter sp.]